VTKSDCHWDDGIEVDVDGEKEDVVPETRLSIPGTT